MSGDFVSTKQLLVNVQENGIEMLILDISLAG